MKMHATRQVCHCQDQDAEQAGPGVTVRAIISDPQLDLLNECPLGIDDQRES